MSDSRRLAERVLRLEATAILEPIDRRDPDAQALAVYAYLGWLQEQVVQAMQVAGS